MRAGERSADGRPDLGPRETEMLRLHVRRRLSERLDGVAHGPEGSLDKLLMTWTEQTVGHAALAVAGTGGPRAAQRLPLQPRAVRHGRHLADPEEHHRRAHPRVRSLELTMYDMPDEIDVVADGPLRIITLNRPDALNAVNDALHTGLARLWPRLSEDPDAAPRCSPGAAGRSRPAATSSTWKSSAATRCCARRRSRTAGTWCSAWRAAGCRSSRRSTARRSGSAAAWSRSATSSTWPRPPTWPTRTSRSAWSRPTADRSPGRCTPACCWRRSTR